tara:strand:- start:714 stop:992 length:279 start_codon:yes stop_codon:yes gene_type:complete
MLRNKDIQNAKPMNREEYENLLRYLSEERAHLRFGEDAVEFNAHTGELEFTHRANKYIRSEEGVLEMTFEQFGFKPKQSLSDRFKNLFGRNY